MMKRKFTKLVIVCVLMLCGVSAYAYDFEENGIYYKINITDKTAIVTYGDNKYEGDIIIPASVLYANQDLPVTEIDVCAFDKCEKLTNIVLPNSLLKIGNRSFRECKGLSMIEIPNSVMEIEEEAFYECKGLTEAKISNSLKIIKKRTFGRCSKLSTVNIPPNLLKIEDYAFEDCNISSIFLPNTLEYLSGFNGCLNIISIEIPNSVQEIGSSAFYGSGLESVNLPESLKKIGSHAFLECENLNSIVIPNSVLEIGRGAFRECLNLNSIVLSNNIEEISEGLFYECRSLKSITIPSSVKVINFSTDYDSENPFYGCTSLEELIIEDSFNPIAFRCRSGESTHSMKVSLFQECPISYLYYGRNLNTNNYRYYDNPFKKILYLSKLSIGQYVTNVESISPENNTDLEIISCYSPDPPKIKKFTNVQYANINVNVPFGSLSEFQNSDIWSNFWNINESLENPYAPKEISLNKTLLNLNINETFVLTAKVLPLTSHYRNVIWNSSDSEIVTVDENGMVTAINEGEGIVTATSTFDPSLYAECKVIVTDPNAGGENVLLNMDSKISIYSIEGLLIKKDCWVAELKSLPKGIYILVSGKDRYKISI